MLTKKGSPPANITNLHFDKVCFFSQKGVSLHKVKSFLYSVAQSTRNYNCRQHFLRRTTHTIVWLRKNTMHVIPRNISSLPAIVSETNLNYNIHVTIVATYLQMMYIHKVHHFQKQSNKKTANAYHIDANILMV